VYRHTSVIGPLLLRLTWLPVIPTMVMSLVAIEIFVGRLLIREVCVSCEKSVSCVLSDVERPGEQLVPNYILKGPLLLGSCDYS
jgi:hypothetical protein